jgi:hypothetical protein
MPGGAPGTKQLNIFIEPDLRDWARMEARRLRLPMKALVEIALWRLQDYIEKNGDSEFFPAPIVPQAESDATE